MAATCCRAVRAVRAVREKITSSALPGPIVFRRRARARVARPPRPLPSCVPARRRAPALGCRRHVGLRGSQCFAGYVGSLCQIHHMLARLLLWHFGRSFSSVRHASITRRTRMRCPGRRCRSSSPVCVGVRTVWFVYPSLGPGSSPWVRGTPTASSSCCYRPQVHRFGLAVRFTFRARSRRPAPSVRLFTRRALRLLSAPVSR